MAKKLPTLDLFAHALRAKPTTSRKPSTKSEANVDLSTPDLQATMPVSYTNLKLPTSDIV